MSSTLVPWAAYSHDQTETLLAAWLTRTVPGAQHIDGAGGDGGVDVQAQIEGGQRVYEIKSFHDRLTTSQKTQIRKSLQQAIRTQPDMVHWTLVLPLNLSPAENRWFTTTLRPLATIPMDWIGRTQIEAALSQHSDLLWAFAPDSASHRALELLGMWTAEQAAMPRGMADGVERAERLRRQFAGTDPDYDFTVHPQPGQTTIHILPKDPGAGERHPITLGVELRVPVDSPQLTDIDNFLRYGRPTQIPSDYITRLDIDLPGNLNALVPTDPETSVSITTPEQDHWRLSARLMAVRDGAVLNSLPVEWNDRSQGPLGGTWLSGHDRSGLLGLRIRTEPDHTAEIDVTAPASDDVLPEEALPALRFLQHMKQADHLHFQAAGDPVIRLRITGDFVSVPDTCLPVAEALSRIQAATGVLFSMPTRWNSRDADVLYVCDEVLRHGSVQWTVPERRIGLPAHVVRGLLARGPLPRFSTAGRSLVNPVIRLMRHDIPLPSPVRVVITNLVVTNVVTLATVIDHVRPDAILPVQLTPDRRTTCTISLDSAPGQGMTLEKAESSTDLPAGAGRRDDRAS